MFHILIVKTYFHYFLKIAVSTNPIIFTQQGSGVIRLLAQFHRELQTSESLQLALLSNKLFNPLFCQQGQCVYPAVISKSNWKLMNWIITLLTPRCYKYTAKHWCIIFCLLCGLLNVWFINFYIKAVFNTSFLKPFYSIVK